MTEQLGLLMIATVFSNVATWTVATYRANTKTATLQRDFEQHQLALTLTDKRLRMVLRLVVDIARKIQIEVRAADILEMADVLGGE